MRVAGAHTRRYVSLLRKRGATQVEAAALLFPGLALGGLCRIVHSRLDQKLLRLLVLGFAAVSELVLVVHR